MITMSERPTSPTQLEEQILKWIAMQKQGRTPVYGANPKVEEPP